MQEEARRVAEQAQRAAEAAQRRSERAGEAAQQSQAQAAQRDAGAEAKARAKSQREQAEAAALAALQARATAELRQWEEQLVRGQLEDSRQGREADDPSSATLAAQTQVDAAEQTVELYTSGGQSAGQAPSAATQELLESAQEAGQPVFDAKARGKDPTDDQSKAFFLAQIKWHGSIEQDMRIAALAAQARGEGEAGVEAAVDRIASQVNAAVKREGVFVPSSVSPSVEQLRTAVLAEAPDVRQLRSEQYSANQVGQQQLADAREQARTTQQEATRAAQYAADSNADPAPNSTIADAQLAASSKAARLDNEANAAQARVDALTAAYGDAKHPGALNADYEARVADAEVRERSAANEQAQAAYQRAARGDDKTATDTARAKADRSQAALDLALDVQTLTHAQYEDLAAQVELKDSQAEEIAAEQAWNEEALQRPGAYEVTEHNGDKETASTLVADDWDPAFAIRPGSRQAGDIERIDGRYYYQLFANDEGTKIELDPVTASYWTAHDRLEDAQTKATQKADQLSQVKADLGDSVNLPAIDTNRYLDAADAIEQRLQDAKQGVKLAYAGRNAPAHAPDIAPRAPLTTVQDLGGALERQRVAQAEYDTLQAMQRLRQGQRDQAAGRKPGADIDTLRQQARDAQRISDGLLPPRAPESAPPTSRTLRLTPDQEQQMRRQQLPQAQRAYDQQLDTVARLTAPVSTASLRTRQKAQEELSRRELLRDAYQATLELIDARRDKLAAQYEYDHTTFVQPRQDPCAVDDKDQPEYYDTHYTSDYDPTWSIVPGEDGRVSASSLPEGLSPKDVQVHRNAHGDGYTVTFKKDSENLGLTIEDSPVVYRVHAGDYDMHPATARLWETAGGHGDGRLARATADYDAAQARLEEQPPAAKEKPPAAKGGQPQAPAEPRPVLGPDGEPVPTLNLGDENLAHRQQALADDLREAAADRNRALRAGDRAAVMQNALADPKITLLQNEQAAVTAALAWQEADRQRLMGEVDQHSGRPQVQSASHLQEAADDLRDAAITARSTWLSSRNRLYHEQSQRKLATAQAAHDRWHRANPGLAETGSDTWRALQAAKDQADGAERYRVAGAGGRAEASEQSFISTNLSPEQQKDPSALVDLFERDPRLMAQATINNHYVQYGGRPIQMQGRTQLANEVGLAFGWEPDAALQGLTAEQSRRVRQTQDLFTDLTSQQRKVQDRVTDKIVELGGEQARITVLPVVYGLHGEHGGIVKTGLLKVQTGDDEVKYVDEQGWVYDTLDDYRANNSLPVQGVKLVMPQDGNYTVDADGNVKLFVGDARTETGWQHVRRVGQLDLAAGGLGLLAGVVLTVGSFGTLAAPGAIVAALSMPSVMTTAAVATALASGYGLETSAENLYQLGSHGQSVNPFTSAQARMDWLNVGLSLADMPVTGLSTAATLLTQRANRAWQAAADAKRAGDEAKAALKVADAQRYQHSADTLGRPAQVASVPLMAGGLYAFGGGGVELMKNWKHLSAEERRRQLGMLGLNAAGILTPVAAGGYQRLRTAGGGTSTDPVAERTLAERPPNEPDADGGTGERVRTPDDVSGTPPVLRVDDSDGPSGMPGVSGRGGDTSSSITIEPPAAPQTADGPVGIMPDSDQQPSVRVVDPGPDPVIVTNLPRSYATTDPGDPGLGGGAGTDSRSGRTQRPGQRGNSPDDASGVPSESSRARERIQAAGRRPLATPIRDILSAQPVSARIEPRRTTAIAVGIQLGSQALRSVFGLPARVLSDPVVSYLSYPLSGFGRSAYLTASQRTKEAFAAAAQGDGAAARSLINRVIRGSGWRGDKVMEPAASRRLRDTLEDVICLGETVSASRSAWPDAPSAGPFRLHTIQSPDHSGAAVAPKSYLQGVPGLRAFMRGLQRDSLCEFYRQPLSDIRSELLRRIDRMSAEELQRSIDESLPADSPQALLLRRFPEPLQKFQNSAAHRSDLRTAHRALYDQLTELFPHSTGGVDPQVVEGLGGSTNSPETRLGLVSRRAVLTVSTFTVTGWLAKPMNAGPSVWTQLGNSADALSIGTLSANYIYNKKVDERATFNARLRTEAAEAEMSVDAYLETDPDRASERTAVDTAKDNWNKYRDYAGLLSAGRAGFVGAGLMASGSTILAYGAFAQGTLTATWVGLQRIPALRNGALPKTTKALKWGAVGAIVVVPAATVVYNMVLGTGQEKKDSIVQTGWSWVTGLLQGDRHPAEAEESASPSEPAPADRPSDALADDGIPAAPAPPPQPPTQPATVTVDSRRLGTATLRGPAGSNLATLLSQVVDVALPEGGPAAIANEALSQFINLRSTSNFKT